MILLLTALLPFLTPDSVTTNLIPSPQQTTAASVTLNWPMSALNQFQVLESTNLTEWTIATNLSDTTAEFEIDAPMKFFKVQTGQASEFSLSWYDSDNTVVGYYLYEGTNGVYTNKIDCGTNTSYTIPAQLYPISVEVTSYNALGIESTPDAIVVTNPLVNIGATIKPTVP